MLVLPNRPRQRQCRRWEQLITVSPTQEVGRRIGVDDGSSCPVPHATVRQGKGGTRGDLLSYSNCES